MKFYFVYKSLAHPELAGNYVQPFTLAERLTHARQAAKQLGSSIPWLVDAMDNRLKHALGDRPNSEFLIDPNGIILAKRAWSHPAQVRIDLERLVGPVERITRPEDVHLRFELPLKSSAVRGVVRPLDRPEMHAIVCRPKIDPKGLPFFAKMRAEADSDLIERGSGQLYLGLHLDPLHDAHWNNLTQPLTVKLNVVEGIKVNHWELTADKVAAPSDADPREFMVQVEAWQDDRPLVVTVTYFACVGETACHVVRQEYVLHRQRDLDAGRARSKGAGYWDPEGFARQTLAGDKDGDRKLSPTEVHGLVLPHFEHFDTNHDGLLELKELLAVSDWLNFHHRPGPMPGPPRQD